MPLFCISYEYSTSVHSFWDGLQGLAVEAYQAHQMLVSEFSLPDVVPSMLDNCQSGSIVKQLAMVRGAVAVNLAMCKGWGCSGWQVSSHRPAAASATIHLSSPASHQHVGQPACKLQ